MGTLSGRSILLVQATLLAALPACTTWPPPGRGGAAELGRPAPAPADEALAARLACALARFDAVRATSLDQRILTGRAAEAGEMAARAQREVQGGLTRDAAQSLDRLEAETLAISIQLPGGPRATPAACA